MSTIYMPFVTGNPTPVPGGWACYAAHDVHHAQLAKGRRLQNWTVKACCMPYPSYYPSLSSTRYWVPMHTVGELAAAYPGHTWLLWNEPHRPDQANISPRYAVRVTKDWISTIGKNGTIAGYGLSIDNEDRGVFRWRYWKNWLEDFLQEGGPMPDKWHFHAYAWITDVRGVASIDFWRRKLDEILEWNETHGRLPIILSEVGESPELFAWLKGLRDPRIECALWFGDFGEEFLRAEM